MKTIRFTIVKPMILYTGKAPGEVSECFLECPVSFSSGLRVVGDSKGIQRAAEGLQDRARTASTGGGDGANLKNNFPERHLERQGPPKGAPRGAPGRPGSPKVPQEALQN